MKYLSLNDIATQPENTPIWAINSTTGQERGPCMFVLERAGTNERDSIIIPDTWVPLDLTMYAPRDQFLASSRFRDVLRLQAIKLVSHEYAQELLSREGAAEEIERVNREGGGVSVDSAMRRTQEQMDLIELPMRSQLLISRMETMSEVDIVNKIRNIPDLSNDELTAIRKKARSLDQKKVGRATKERILALEGED